MARTKASLCVALWSALLPVPFAAAWDPANRDWYKSNAGDLRVMTWNVEDDIRTGTVKTEGLNAWTALARIVASMKPDILCLQEMGDNACSGCVDTVAEMTTVLGLFLHGGTDPFLGGTVTAYVQAYDPAYDLPYIFVSTGNDGFNRNVIMSRYPFADLNGDTKSQLSDIPLLLPDQYATGGNGGIRGFAFAEINLNDLVYTGNLVIGNAHLKAGSAASDIDARRIAAQNVAYVVDYWYNGAGSGIPDPNNKIIDSPVATSILAADTPVVLAGDWNEDELTNGRKGPTEWLTMAALTGGTDGTDRDRTDMTYDNATHFFTGSRGTIGSSTKFDYVAYQDSIVSLRRAFVFNTSGTPSTALPNELLTYSFPSGASGTASDHRPVIVDLILPLQPTCATNEDCDDDVFCNGAETCNGSSQCQAGSAPCTGGDLCRESDDQCVECLTNGHCADGNPCNGADICNGSGDCTDQLSADCNTNLVEDSCDIDESGASSDCNTNLIPDECDIASQTSPDFDLNGIPDECQDIPTVSTWGLLVFGLLIVASGSILSRRQVRGGVSS